MNKADRYRMAEQVAKIRQLQWNKAQQQAVDARRAADQADAAVDAARQKFATYTSLARQALANTHALSPDLLCGLVQAASSAHDDVQHWHEVATQAQTQWRQQMETLQQWQVQQHEAEHMVDRAKRAYRRQLEEKQANAVEEQWLARSLGSVNQLPPPAGEKVRVWGESRAKANFARDSKSKTSAQQAAFLQAHSFTLAQSPEGRGNWPPPGGGAQ